MDLPVQAKIRDLEAAIAKRPSAPAPYLQLAQVYVDAKRPDLAAQTLERCLAVDPKNAYLRHRLAQLTGKPESAPGKTSASFLAVQRPAAPPAPRRREAFSGRRKAAIAAGIAAALLLYGVKAWMFPSTRCLVAGSFRAYAPVWSPRGTHLAFLMDDGQSTRIAVYDLDKGSFRAIAPIAASDARSFSWSSDGSQLAYEGPAEEGDWQPSVFVVAADGAEPRKVASGTAPAWASDGRTLIVVCRPQAGIPEGDEAAYAAEDQGERYCRVDLDTGTVRPAALEPRFGGALSGLHEQVVFEQGPEDAGEPAAAASEEKDFDELVDSVAAGRARNVAEGRRDLSRELESREYAKRRQAATTAERLPQSADVFIAGLAGGEPVALTSDRHSAFPSWTADRSRILFATNGASGVEFCTIKPDGSDRQTVLSGIKGVDPTSVTLSQDGRHVFFVAGVPGDEGVAQLMTGESPADLHVAPVGSGAAKRLANRHSFKRRYAVAPDGERIVYEVLQDVKLLGGAGKSELWLMRR